jgi:hypothetical protein
MDNAPTVTHLSSIQIANTAVSQALYPQSNPMAVAFAVDL